MFNTSTFSSGFYHVIWNYTSWSNHNKMLTLCKGYSAAYTDMLHFREINVKWCMSERGLTHWFGLAACVLLFSLIVVPITGLCLLFVFILETVMFELNIMSECDGEVKRDWKLQNIGLQRDKPAECLVNKIFCFSLITSPSLMTICCRWVVFNMKLPK